MTIQNDLLMLKGAITMMDESDQSEIKACCEQINAIVDSYTTGAIALALVGLERSIEG